MNEIRYHLKRLDAKRIAVTKLVDGEFEPPTYMMENSNCDCPGAVYHKTECKHLKVKKAWEKLGEGAYCFEVKKNGEIIPYKLKDLNADEEATES